MLLIDDTICLLRYCRHIIDSVGSIIATGLEHGFKKQPRILALKTLKKPSKFPHLGISDSLFFGEILYRSYLVSNFNCNLRVLW